MVPYKALLKALCFSSPYTHTVLNTQYTATSLPIHKSTRTTIVNRSEDPPAFKPHNTRTSHRFEDPLQPHMTSDKYRCNNYLTSGISCSESDTHQATHLPGINYPGDRPRPSLNKHTRRKPAGASHHNTSSEAVTITKVASNADGLLKPTTDSSNDTPTEAANTLLTLAELATPNTDGKRQVASPIATPANCGR